MEEDEYYIYDFENGLIINKRTGEPIRRRDNKGYITLHNSIFGNKRAHRILYEKYHKITIPDGMQVNHINGVKDCNRIDNLELVTNQQNKQHTGKQKNNKSGHKNISWHKASNKWMVDFQIDGRKQYYGIFSNLQDAIKARDQAIAELNANGHRYITQFPQT